MNYYPFHVGDFAAHTAHLSFEEDIAYRRMLDWYYLNEKALPLDAGKVARLIRMPKSLPAIQVVLDEFFEKSEDGWQNKRADEELSEMQAKQEQRAIKDEHEAERIRRYRERRAVMFAALREAGVVPAWDLPMKELQRLHEANCNAPATHLQREQVVSCNAPATAIPIANSQQPIANSQQPIEEEGERASAPPRKRSAPAQLEQPADVDEQTWQDWLALRKAKKAPVTATVLTQARTESDKAGMPLAAFLRIWCARGSQGLQAAWLKDSERATNNGMSGMSFAQLDERDRRARWEEMTGRKWPNAPNAATAQEFSEAEIKGVTHEPTHQSH